jgi:hypothetical protein
MHMSTSADALAPVTWFKSSYSNPHGGDCVEGARLADGAMAVRDSKDPHGPAFLFPEAAWSTFVASVKLGAFDI